MPAVQKDIRNLIETLTEQEKVLVICVYELYDGSWDRITHDLVERLEGRPFVFKLGERIRDDLERVRRLRGIEQQYNFKLGDYVKI